MIGTDMFLTIYCLFWLAVLGSVAGSTLDCMAWRYVNGESPLKGRSHCGSCGHVLGVRDLIPIVSYLAGGGTCRYCGEKIPSECLVAELAGVLVYVSLGIHFDISMELLMWLIAGSILLLLSLIDWHVQLLPDQLLMAAIVNRILFMFILGQPLGQTAIRMLTGAFSVSLPLLVIVLIMDKVVGRETMGGGDIKLLFVLGLYMTWMQMFLILLAGCLLALVAAVWMKQKRPDGAISFGPFLAIAWLIVLLFGDPLIQWYLSLFI
jgi:prepilin signal peptidase PulO-like enzyme (type II secretory pathway)